MATVKKYTRIRKLTAKVLYELIEYIEVFDAEKQDGITVQNIVIHYNFIGAVQVPDEVTVSGQDVTVKTRPGVSVNYTPSLLPEKAV